MRIAAIFLWLSILGCSPAPADPRPDPPRSVEPRPVEPRPVEPPRPVERPLEPARPTAERPPTPSSSGCDLGTPAVALASAGPFAIVATPDAFVVAAYGADGTSVSLVRVTDAGATLVASASLEVALDRRAGPALAWADGRLALAVVDGGKRLMLSIGALDASVLTLRPIAEGASLRFAPAVAPTAGRWAIAWTDERATPMRVRGRVVDGAGSGGTVRDLSPTGGGAAAPRFTSGAPELTYIDPRVAISVVYRVALSASDFGTPEVLRPVGNAAEPPEIAVVRVGEQRWVGYTAVGSAAMTAVGLVRAGDQAPPRPIVPGRGYGELYVDVASAGDRAIFVADAPVAAPAASAREIHVRVLSGDVLAEPIVVRAEPGASHARIARRADGRFALAFRAGDAVQVALGRCE